MKGNKGVALYCPVCSRGKVVVAADRQQAGKIRLHPPSEAENVVCFAKCGVCGNQIGVSFSGKDLRNGSYLPIVDTCIT